MGFKANTTEEALFAKGSMTRCIVVALKELREVMLPRIRWRFVDVVEGEEAGLLEGSGVWRRSQSIFHPPFPQPVAPSPESFPSQVFPKLLEALLEPVALGFSIDPRRRKTVDARWSLEGIALGQRRSEGHRRQMEEVEAGARYF